MVDTLFLTAMVSEYFAVIRQFKTGRRQVEGQRAMLATVGNQNVGALQMGIGPARARKGAAWAIRHLEPSQVIVFGVAGGLDPDLRPGDVVHADAVINSTGERIELPVERLSKVAPSHQEFRSRMGTIVLSEHVVKNPIAKANLFAQSGAIAVDMESHAVALACTERDIPVRVVRIVTDTASDHLPAEIDLLMSEEGNPRLMTALWRVARRPRLLAELLRMEQNNRVALRSMQTWAARFMRDLSTS